MFMKSKITFLKQLKRGAVALCLLLAVFLSGVSSTQEAWACDSCYAAVSSADSNIWQESQDNFDRYLDREFKRVEEFIIQEMWEQSILPVMMEAATQFTAVALQQAMMIGMFIDAESQLDAQRLLQELRAKVHKDYHPSVGMCEFGSVVKSLAVTELRNEVFPIILSKRSRDRQLGKGEASGQYGNDLDHANRIRQFSQLFCNEKDRQSALEAVCTNTVSWGNAAFDQPARLRMNKDIDYFELMESPWNIGLDFTNQDIVDYAASPQILNQDEEHLMAMSSNLFGHTIFPRPPAILLENDPDKAVSAMQKLYLDMRAILAKRSVAENSLYSIAALKAGAPVSSAPSGGAGACHDPANSGSTGCSACVEGDGVTCPTPAAVTVQDVPGGPINSRVYMEHILAELGVPAPEVLDMLGYNPSYFAQMEVLTKKIYQNPDFYTNLYDKPANVERKTVALQAIKLMQKFDMLKSHLRGEATVSILLELAVEDLQNEVEDQIKALGGG